MNISLEEQTKFEEPVLKKDIVNYLATTDEAGINRIQRYAEQVLLKNIGNKVFFRGLVEASNICKQDCYYCGIRKHNRLVDRYQLALRAIVDAAKQAKLLGYASFVIQAGEQKSPAFVDYIEAVVKAVKTETRCEQLPNGLGITLSVGEQSQETYERFYAAGAHRYLLRIETTNPDLFARIHPPEQTLACRMASLQRLRDVGFQVGSGVMIGIPGQTLNDLAEDILFFKDFDVDMIGMGPFIPDPAAYAAGGMDEKNTPPSIPERVRLTLLMTALTRITLKDINIAATTALQTLDPEARIRALHFGANVMMPQLTPPDVRKRYRLYPKKPISDEAAKVFNQRLEKRIQQSGREIGFGEWGDSPHALKKRLSCSILCK